MHLYVCADLQNKSEVTCHEKRVKYAYVLAIRILIVYKSGRGYVNLCRYE